MPRRSVLARLDLSFIRMTSTATSRKRVLRPRIQTFKWEIVGCRPRGTSHGLDEIEALGRRLVNRLDAGRDYEQDVTIQQMLAQQQRFPRQVMDLRRTLVAPHHAFTSAPSRLAYDNTLGRVEIVLPITVDDELGFASEFDSNGDVEIFTTLSGFTATTLRQYNDVDRVDALLSGCAHGDPCDYCVNSLFDVYHAVCATFHDIMNGT
jgi:hypothetical protein